MDALKLAVDLVLHLDQHLTALVDWAGMWTYVILFLVIFCETGLVVTPFLPGDSLLFSAGALAALGSSELRPLPLAFALFLAAVLGDSVNYSIGRTFGAKMLQRRQRWIRPSHIQRTQEFFDRYGSKAIVLARFVPIVRTFGPFLAGMGTMNYRRFATWNVIGGAAWVFPLVGAGAWFGNLPWIRDNFGFVVIGIIALSLTPIAYELLRDPARRARVKAELAESAPAEPPVAGP